MANEQDHFSDYKTAFSSEFDPDPQTAAEALNNEYENQLQQAAELENKNYTLKNLDNPLIHVESKAVNALGYEEESQTLRIQYNNNSQYDYQQVPSEVVAELEQTDSVGRFINREIKGHFTANEVATETALDIETFAVPTTQQQSELFQVARSLTQPGYDFTNSEETNTTQIGKFQIWRDENNLAVVNVEENQLLVYSDLQQDLLPTTVKPENIQAKDNLWSKIQQQHPDLKRDYSKTHVAEAWQKFQRQDPLTKNIDLPLSGAEPQVPSLSNLKIIEKQLNKLPERYQNTKNWLQKISENKPLQQLSDSVAQPLNWMAERAKAVILALEKKKIEKQINIALNLDNNRRITQDKPLSLGKNSIIRNPKTNNLLLLDGTDKPLSAVKIDRNGTAKVTGFTYNLQRLKQATANLSNFNAKNNPINLEKDLIEAVHQKWQKGRQASKENTFNLGDYQIYRHGNNYHLTNPKQSPLSIVAFEEKKEWLGRKSLQPLNPKRKLDKQRIQTAIKTLSDPSLAPLGVKQALRQRIILQTYNAFQGEKDNRIAIGDNLLTREREREKFTISDRQGKPILSFKVTSDSAGNNSFNLLSTTANPQKLEQTASNLISPLKTRKNQTELAKQQNRVDIIAPSLADYLNLKRTAKVDTPKSSVEYQSETKTLVYRDKVNSDEKLKATWNGKSWLDTGSNISEEKTKQFQTEFAPNIATAKKNQKQQSQKAQVSR